MTKEEVKKAAEIMLAYANGKEIEMRMCEGSYVLLPKEAVPAFNWWGNINSYRIKEEE